MRPWNTSNQQLNEFIKFCVVGISGIFINLGGYILLTRSLGMPIEIASPIAIEASIIWNFLGNNIWTFGNRITKGTWQTRLLWFHVVCVLGGALNYIILLLLVRVGWWDIAANLVGIAVGVVAKYFINSQWTWQEVKLEP